MRTSRRNKGPEANLDPTPAATDHRAVNARISLATSSLAATAAVALLAGLVRSPSFPETQVAIGKVSDFPTESPTVLMVSRQPGSSFRSKPNTRTVKVEWLPPWRSFFNTFVLRDPELGVVVFDQRDPHLGCRLILVPHNRVVSQVIGRDGRPRPGPPLPENVFFFDPCHGESYSKSGECISGPCVRRGMFRIRLVPNVAGLVVLDLTSIPRPEEFQSRR